MALPEEGCAARRAGFALNVARTRNCRRWLSDSPWSTPDLKKEFNPIYVVDTATKEELRIETGTRMNHDVVCSSRGVLAFRAQVASWDDIFVAPLVRMP
jgi:hypothetical protein